MKVINSGKHCVFCKGDDSDELSFGGLKVTKHLKAHYYCLLLSETITQSGNDNQGILGFLASDISGELARAKSKQCCYCKEYGANLGCKSKFCNRKFHLPCGLLEGTQNNFNDFTCLCHQHRRHSNIPVYIKRALASYKCLICLDNFDPKTSTRTIVWADCCKAEIVLHLSCIKELALSAGYFTKCPGCNNNMEFIQTIKFYGVFVPERDASWEMASNSFAELYYVHHTCDVETCLCPNGRDFSIAKGKWKLFLCSMCGSFGTHQICSQVKRQFVCCTCKSIEHSTPATSEAKNDDPGEALSSASTADGCKETDEENCIVVVDSSDDEVPKVSKATSLLNRIRSISSDPSTSSSVANLNKSVAKKSTTKLPYSYTDLLHKGLTITIEDTSSEDDEKSNCRRSPRNVARKHATKLSRSITNKDNSTADATKLEKNMINSLDDEIVDVVSYSDKDMNESLTLISKLSQSLLSLCSSTITSLFNNYTFENENIRIFNNRNVALKSTTKLPLKRKKRKSDGIFWHQERERPVGKRIRSNGEVVCFKPTVGCVTDFNLAYSTQGQNFLLNSPIQIVPSPEPDDDKRATGTDEEIECVNNTSSVAMNAQFSTILMQLSEFKKN